MSGNHLSEMIEVINSSEKIMVATHIFPDGDALGSQLGLSNILEGMGKKVIRYSEEAVSHLYDFLPETEKLVTELPSPEEIDCVIALDCGDRFRLGKEMDVILENHKVMVIDHHAGHKDFGILRWVESGRSSTGEMVYELAQKINADVSYEAAYCLYTAIVSDTGSFKYASTTSKTFNIAGELLAKGVNPEEVSIKLFDNFTESRLHMLQSVLSTLELYSGGRLAIISATKKMFEITGADQKDTETFINYPRSLASVKIVAFFKETENAIGVSMRAKGNDIDVSAIARSFGGGGHRKAAGCKFRDGESLKDVRDKIMKELLSLLNSLDS